MRAAFAGAADDLRDAEASVRLKALVRRFVRFSAERPELGRILALEGARPAGPAPGVARGAARGPAYGELEALIVEGQGEGWAKPLPVGHVMSAPVAAAAFVFSVTGYARAVGGTDDGARAS